MRKREAIQPRNLGNVEADALPMAAGRKNRAQSESGRFHRGPRAWRAHKGIHAYLGDLTASMRMVRAIEVL